MIDPRALLVLLLAGCTASNWIKEGATTADFDRDYDECRDATKLNTAAGALAGVFGAVGIFVGTTIRDNSMRTCLRARGWSAGPDDTIVAAPPPAPPAAAPLRATDVETSAERRLRELKTLSDQGLITREEYEQKRQAILRDL